MRKDMAKVVTERPRRGHGLGMHERNQWTKTRGKVRPERDDDDLPTSVISRHVRPGYKKDYDDGLYGKAFSDLLGPLRGYLRKQVGRPWDKVWSELSANLDKRSVSGSHIFDHIKWEVEQDAWLGLDGKVYATRRYSREPSEVSGLYVHPRTRLLCKAKETSQRDRSRGAAMHALQGFALVSWDTPNDDLRRYRVEVRTKDTARLWEKREAGWFILDYVLTPEWKESVPYVPRYSWEKGKGHPEFTTKVHPATWSVSKVKQAGKREIRAARALLERDPLGGKR